jgi:hypothetical protein
MMEILQEIAAAVPHFWWLTSFPLVILVGQILFLRHALRQRRRCLTLVDAARSGDWAQVDLANPSRQWPAVVCALSVLAIPALALGSIASARTLLLPSASESDPSSKAGNLARGLSGAFNAIPWTIILLAPTVLLATFSVALSVSVYRRRKRLSAAARIANTDPTAALAHANGWHPSGDSLAAIPLAFLAFGLFPVVSGAWAHTIRVLQGFGAIAKLPPGNKGAVLLFSLEEARELFAARAVLAYPGTAIAVLISAVLLVRWKRLQSPTMGLTWRSSVFWSILCLTTALLFFSIAAPFRAENNLPWLAPRMDGDDLRVDLPSGPQLRGPDSIQRSPILHMTNQGAALDGRLTDVQYFEDSLRASLQSYQFLNPHQQFAGHFLVLWPADAPMRSLRSYLAAAANSGYHNPIFTFTERETQQRPILGTLTRVLTSAARATVQTDPPATAIEPDVATLQADEFSTYGQLARRLVDLRRDGKRVWLRL